MTAARSALLLLLLALALLAGATDAAAAAASESAKDEAVLSNGASAAPNTAVLAEQLDECERQGNCECEIAGPCERCTDLELQRHLIHDAEYCHLTGKKQRVLCTIEGTKIETYQRFSEIAMLFVRCILRPLI
eukprot:m.188894 g.188894  ORF g.188894 m.188894 type:complete len:133 (+) comp10561_c0_seq2:1979-2377(+)